MTRRAASIVAALVVFGLMGARAPTARADALDAGDAEAAGPTPVTVPGSTAGWRLTFDDEFNETAIDTCKWQFRYKWGERVVNQEQEAYVSAADAGQAFSFDGGILAIVGRKQQAIYAGRLLPYTSGLLVSLHEQMYGYFESRVRMPTGPGLWPAFWLLHSTAYPDVHEIDIMEWVSPTPETTYMTDHFGTSYDIDDETFQYTAMADDYSTSFHVFGLDWEADRIVWYQDGVEVGRVVDAKALQPVVMYVIQNLAIGGDWPGSPPQSATWPVEYDIDYVRAYQHDGTLADPAPPFGTDAPLELGLDPDAGTQCPVLDASAEGGDATIMDPAPGPTVSVSGGCALSQGRHDARGGEITLAAMILAAAARHRRKARRSA